MVMGLRKASLERATPTTSTQLSGFCLRRVLGFRVKG